MPATATDRIDGVTTSVAVKAPCVTVATSNITLSGLQTISGVTLAEHDRVLVSAQTNSVDNGVYNASSGSWTRAKDFDGNRDAVQGTRVLVALPGSSSASEYELTSSNPIVIGTTALTFVLRYGANATYDRTPAEFAAGVTPGNPFFAPGLVMRYMSASQLADWLSGASVVDMSSAFITAVSCNKVVTVPYSQGNYKNTATVTVPTGVTIKFEGGIVEQASGSFTFANGAHIAASETQQCFTSSSTAIGLNDSCTAAVYAAWFGFGSAFTAAQNKAALLLAMNCMAIGGTVMLPRTSVSINGDIVPPFNGIRLVGSGWPSGYNNATGFGSVLIAASGTNLFDCSAIFGGPNPNEYFRLEGIKCDGNGVVANGIKIMGTKSVAGCLFTGFTTAGIWLADYINGTLIEDTSCIANGAAGAGVGLLVDGVNTTKFTIRNCNFRLNFRGMEIRSGANFTLQDCVFESNTERGLLEQNSDGKNLAVGLHINLWFENNNSAAGTRNQYTLGTTATSSVFYPQNNRWIHGNINGSSVVGQRAMDINSNCLNTIFQGTRFGGQVGDTGAIFVAASTNTIFEDCIDVDTFGSASAVNYRQRDIIGARVDQAVTVIYGAAVGIDAQTGNEFIVTATNGTAFTVNAPTNPRIGQPIEITIRNTSGGALGVVTWNAAFKMSAWTSPATGNSRTIAFRYDGTNWVQRFQAGVDVPN